MNKAESLPQPGGWARDRVGPSSTALGVGGSDRRGAGARIPAAPSWMLWAWCPPGHTRCEYQRHGQDSVRMWPGRKGPSHTRAPPHHSSSLHSAPTRHPCLSGGQGGCRSGHTADSEWGDGRPDNQARRRLIHRAPVPPDQPWTGGRAPAKGPPSQRELSSP